jgi:hypothetical protein
MPAIAAMRRAKPRLVYQRGARKMNRDSPARSLCVAVIVPTFSAEVVKSSPSPSDGWQTLSPS